MTLYLFRPSRRPYSRTSLKAASFASEPLWPKQLRPPNPCRAMASASNDCGSLSRRLPTCHSLPACPVADGVGHGGLLHSVGHSGHAATLESIAQRPVHHFVGPVPTDLGGSGSLHGVRHYEYPCATTCGL